MASSADTWETKDLSGAPFNVPAGVVVEVAIRNSDTTVANDRYGGVRAVGSSLDRRLQLHPADGGGWDVTVMHVQADDSSQIQHYADDTVDIEFILLGYWNCGTYVEAFDSFTVSAGAWTDQDLNGFGVGPGDVAEIVLTNHAPSASYDAGVRTNGSSLERRVTLETVGLGNNGVDAATMLVAADASASATIEAYSGQGTQVVFQFVGHWTVPPGEYTEAFTDIGSPSSDATWEDKDLTGSGVSDGAVVGIMFANGSATEENQLGVRANGSSLSRLLNIHQAEAGGDDFGAMHVQTDSSAVIELYHQDVSDTHNFYLTGYWEVGTILADHDVGQATDAFSESGGETNAELFAFKLAPCAGSLTVTELVFTLSGIVGLTDGDWAGVELVVDANGDGNIGVGETTTVGGTGAVNQAAGTITFSTSFALSADTQYILRADFASLSIGDEVTIALDKDDITASDVITGSTTPVTHIERCYFEAFQPWTATSADAWETTDLSGAPFNVPGSAVVEVAVRNSAITAELLGGVRAVGSSLDRRFLLHEAEGGGIDTVVMHVQANAASQIQHYSDDTASVDFVLVGYWECGTYAELFDTFTAGAGASWQDRDLCPYGVGPEHVAEIVMTNDDPDNEREAGVRTNGSALERRLNLHEAEDGGVDAATMFVQADASANATIELYAQDDADIDFYLVGYWSAAPLAYTELFVTTASPASDGTWQDLDLTGSGVPDNAVAEFALANGFATEENSMGVRENGSSRSRVLQLHEAEDGGEDLARMHVQTEATATVETYHQDVSDTHAFRVVGYWVGCDDSLSYSVADLGAVTAAKSSLGFALNAAENVAGFDEDASGDGAAWYAECGGFTSLGTLGGPKSEALDINDSNQVVGWAHTAAPARRAFSWTSGGGMTDLGTVSGRTQSEALGLNANGEIVGTVADWNPNPYNRLAFMYLPAPAYTLGAGMTSLGTLGGTQSVAVGINDSGQVVGGAQEGSENFRPFRWQNGTMTDLGTLGGSSKSPFHRGNAINASGDVVGMSVAAGGADHAFYWDGSMADLGVLSGGTTSFAAGINDSNVVVGSSNVTGGAFHAFVWNSTNGMRDLNDLIPGGSGWTLTRALDVNNDGSIVGWGTNPSGDLRAFLLTPTCSTGGGGAAAILATGSGATNESGELDELVVDSAGLRLGSVGVRGALPEVPFEYTAASVDAATPGGTASDPSMLPVRRTLTVTTTEPAGAFRATIVMTTDTTELSTLGLAAGEVELLALESSPTASGRAWMPAGVYVGESEPTDVLGESGFSRYGDGTVDYWAVRDSVGTFAIGRRVSPSPGGDGASRGVRLCGVAMFQAMTLCIMGLLAARRRRARIRPSTAAPIPMGPRSAVQVHTPKSHFPEQQSVSVKQGSPVC
jgi:probable HAF family extracellular repeat protein